jgi:isopenicillin N synthase-like dioxygenase
MTSFTSIPVLSLAAARDASTKPRFLEDLRSALLNVGFCYLSDTGLPKDLVEKVCDQTVAFFDENVLPLAEKENIEMKNEKSFLGWSRVSAPHIHSVLCHKSFVWMRTSKFLHE